MFNVSIPSFLLEQKEFKEITKVVDIENIDLQNKIIDLQKQCFIKTATWGLSYWEQNLGIKTNNVNTIEERRATVLAKLRGRGTTTIKVLEDICKSYADYVTVKENNKQYSFTINLESINKGFPFKLDGLYKTINEIKPAHLESNYKLKSTTKNKIKFASMTRCAEIITVYPYTPKETKVFGKIYIPINNNNTLETTTIYPKGGN